MIVRCALLKILAQLGGALQLSQALFPLPNKPVMQKSLYKKNSLPTKCL